MSTREFSPARPAASTPSSFTLDRSSPGREIDDSERRLQTHRSQPAIAFEDMGWPSQPLAAPPIGPWGANRGRDFIGARAHGDTRAARGARASSISLIGAAFAPERPPPSSQSSRAGHSSHPAELQAQSVGARIGRALESVPVAPGPISEAIRQAAEPALGTSLEGVQLQVGSSPHAKATRERALAMTDGVHVNFADGQFAPSTPRGRALIGHELTHVAQQRFHARPTIQRFALVLDYDKLAREIEDAISGLGTDEEAIYGALTKLHRDPDSIVQLEAAYRRLFSETLMEALEGDLDQEELDYAKGLLGKAVTAGSKQRIETTIPVTAAQWDTLAGRIKAAVEHRTLGIFGGTDEEAIFAVLQPLAGDANKIAELKKAYARVTAGPPTALVDAIRGEMSGSELHHALDLLTVADPHAGTQSELSRNQVLAVRNELQPGSAVPVPSSAVAPLPPPTPWDGRVGAPGAASKRAALQTELTTDLTNHLARVMPGITAEASAPKLPITALQGAANAAVEVTDDEYKEWYAVAAATPSQAALRAGFQFSQAAGNLFDATDPVARAAVGIPLSADSVAHWMVRNDDPPVPPGAIEHMAAHNFDPDRTGFGENTWLQTNVITPFVAPPARNAQLLLYDQFGFALQPQPGKIVLPTTVPGSSLSSGGAPNLNDRAKLWSTWHIAVHEYLHNLVHPRFENAIRGPVMNEGFTEYFTKGVLSKAAPVAHQNAGLVQKVEGGTFAPPTTPALVGPYATPPSYAANLAHVENVAGTVPGGDNALRASYFQGHVEMLGIDPGTGAFVTTPPVSVDPSLVNVPAGIPNLDDLAPRSGVPKSEILSANVGLAAAGPLPPRLRLPGAREHMVASTLVPLGPGPTETAEQIAAQNGVSVEALKRANPSVTWAALTSGQRVLIPRH